ncbi:MAG: ABC transporter ATP-binding protein [Candidatus Neomarinimicrobiota bacterium]|nr:ABC transporter ATP-binding protein [Candidatus Neomarinimicrobiota bacterium]RKY51143.1 MAG: ABC transporter ATP-binding protein [Candidatus Neomarinimicrobiota bacterium]
MKDKPIITVKNLTKKFGHFIANDALTFDVYPGEIFGFLGANGAGKTTAMRILCGLSKPSSGDAYVAGYSVKKAPEKIKKRIGYMSQKFSLYEDLTVEENIRFYGGIYGLKRKDLLNRMEELLDRLDIKSIRHQIIRSVPTGWRQKLAFSIAILHKPVIVFLDEPTGGVDPAARRQFWELIYEAADNGITVFVTTHYMDEAEYCDRVCIMTEGRIVALDTPDNLKMMHQCNTIENVFIKLARNHE